MNDNEVWGSTGRHDFPEGQRCRSPKTHLPDFQFFLSFSMGCIHMSNRQNKLKTKVVGSRPGLFKFA